MNIVNALINPFVMLIPSASYVHVFVMFCIIAVAVIGSLIRLGREWKK